MFLYIIVNVPRPPRVDSRPSDNLAGADKQSLPRVETGGTFLKNFLLLLSILGILESFMGIIQFIIQHSIGLYWLKESNIYSGGAGIAKIIIDNQKFIRSYGTFPHPNIFAGFLTLSICATIILRFINNYSNIHKNIETNDYVKIVPRGTISFLLKKSLYIQIIALFLTFSKSAIFGLFAGFIIVNVPQIKNVFNNFNVPKNIFGLFKKNVLAYYLSALFALCIILFLFLQVNMHFFITQSIDERLFYINVSRGTIANNSIIGVGMNNFVLNMQKYSSLDLLDWQYQPVHNVFLLIWSELGFIGLFIFVCLLFYIIKKNYYLSLSRISHANIFRTTNALILCQVFILLFDHYQWDIQQGEIIFWLSIALFFSINGYNNKLLYVVSKK